jgi:sugar (pentulose or hexulose) kinase
LNEKFKITGLNFSAYGATVVHLDKKGRPVAPIYNYLKPYPEKLQDKFYQENGGEDAFCVITASPPMGMLNSGLQLYWLKYMKPEYYKNIYRTLHLPQYLSYLFTGEYNTELTSIGCHTGLWNFQENDYHEWIKREGIDFVLPEPCPVTNTRTVKLGDQVVKVGKGIHDSSAALAPFLIAIKTSFLLLSTGTWSITLNPFNQEPLSADELHKDCLCYKDITGKSVKAARFFMGGELEHQVKKLGERFNKSLDYFQNVKMNPDLIKKIVSNQDKSRMLKLETAYGSGPFPDIKHDTWNIDQFDSYEEAYHQLLVDLVSIQIKSLNLAMGDTAIDKFFITGGFGKNTIFMKLLATQFPDKEIYSVQLQQSSALGAAMVVQTLDARNTERLQARINLERYTPIAGLRLNQYEWIPH